VVDLVVFLGEINTCENGVKGDFGNKWVKWNTFYEIKILKRVLHKLVVNEYDFWNKNQG